MRGISVRAVSLFLLGASLVLGSAVEVTAKEKVYEPPYKEGPSGGDEWNYISADPNSGEMSIYRLFPGFSPVVGCAPEPSAGWAMFRIEHKAVAPLREVSVNFEARLDPYAWMTLGVRKQSKDWIGVAKLQGPHNGSGRLKLRLPRQVRVGEEVEIEFGLQLGDACPQVGHAHATFEAVTVK
ncbi:MAG: hypothetical protein ABR505_02085 [Actinomycetota bacterium]